VLVLRGIFISLLLNSIVELADCNASDQSDNGDCCDLADDSGVELYNASIDLPDSCMTGDTPHDLMMLGGGGPVPQASPTPGFPRIGHTSARCQPGMESRDLDRVDDGPTVASELSANHSAPKEVVVTDDAEIR